VENHAKVTVRDDRVRTLDEQQRPRPRQPSEDERVSSVAAREAEAAPSADRAPKQTRRRPVRSERVSEAGDIRVESGIIGRARAALRDGDAAVASRLLDEHASFPRWRAGGGTRAA